MLHDLALALGQPVRALSAGMTERELRRWAKYRREKLLPIERIEIHLAQIAYWIAQSMGGVQNATIGDYIIERKQDEPADDDDALESAKDFFGFDPK